jgi:cytochrome c553
MPSTCSSRLKNFKADGKRPNPVMNGMVAALSEDQMRNIAAWFASQSQKGEQAKNRETVEFGQKLYRAGDQSQGPARLRRLPRSGRCRHPAQYPRIGGQFAEYTEAQLKAFRAADGVRANDPNKMMRMVALKMTDAEIKAVSDYIAGLR